jgi:hypothetical protein
VRQIAAQLSPARKKDLQWVDSSIPHETTKQPVHSGTTPDFRAVAGAAMMLAAEWRKERRGRNPDASAALWLLRQNRLDDLTMHVG